MIPIFPNFELIQPKHIEEIRSITRSLPHYSDYGPLSLLCWDTNQSTRVSKLYGNLVLITDDYTSPTRNLCLIGKSEANISVSRLLNYADRHNLDTGLRFVPEVIALAILENNNSDYAVIEDRDNHDYIIDLRYIANLEGKRLRRLRQQINIYTKNVPHGMTALDLSDPSTINEIINVFKTRESNKPKNDEHVELAALCKLLKLQKYFDLEAKGIFVSGKLQAFLIIEKSEDILIAHFGKANLEFKGIYYYLLHQCCKEFSSRGYQKMNLEQDLGISGLRESKRQLRPQLLKKYTILRKS